MSTNDTVGERIRMLRGLETQTEFALRIGVTQRAVVNYETLGRVPKKAILRKICEQYDVDERWLLTGNGPMNQSQGARGSEITKTCDMSPVLKGEELQQADFTDCRKTETCDMSQVLVRELTARCLRLSDDNADLLRQNGDLRVEAERLRMDVERRDARIAELERQLVEALNPPGGQTLLEKRGAAAG